MFSTCSELTPRAPIPDGRMERFMHPCTECVILHKKCNLTHGILLHTVYTFTHSVYFYTQCIILNTECKFTHWLCSHLGIHTHGVILQSVYFYTQNVILHTE